MRPSDDAIRSVRGHKAVHRLVVNSAISFEYFRNIAIRLLVNSAMTLGNSKGDLTVASL